MRRLKAPRSIRSRWILALAVGSFLAVALILSHRLFGSSGSVKLLHIGYSELGELGNRVRCPEFCLTNGTSKPIVFSGHRGSRGTPRWVQETRTPSGWSDSTFRLSASLNSPNFVLRPGQSVNFHDWPAPGSTCWRVGVTYWHCKLDGSVPKTLGNEILNTDSLYGIRTIRGSGIEREQTFMQRVQAKMPNWAPAWFKRYVASKARDPIAWGPEMQPGRLP